MARSRYYIYGLILLFLLLLTACSRPFFYPDQRVRLTPDKLGLDYLNVRLTTDDGTRLHAWHLLPKVAPKGIILVLHGNAENISTHIHSVAWLVREGYELLLLDYRGYGLSEGRPSLPRIFRDIDTAADWIDQRSELKHIPVYWLGQSIGASISAYYLADSGRQNIQAVILDSPFASYRRIGREKFSEFWLTWLFQYPLSWLIDNRYSPEKKALQWPSIPVLLYTSSTDQVIPSHHTKELYQRLYQRLSSNGSEITLIETEGPHIGTYSDKSNRDKTLNFLSKYIY